jgi:hypothetical protein
MALATIAVLDGQRIAPADYRHPVEWIAMPRCRLTGGEAQSADENPLAPV